MYQFIIIIKLYFLTPVLVAWKFGDGTDSSALASDPGSKLGGSSQNSSRFALNGDINIT